MKEEQPWLLVQHVAVDCRHVDAIRPQSRDHRVHFIARKHEIASNCSLAAAGRLEVDRRGYAHRSHRRNLHAAFHDRVAAWHSKLINAAVGFANGVLLVPRASRITAAILAGSPWPPTCK